MGDEMHTTGACGPAGGPRTAHQAIAAFTLVLVLALAAASGATAATSVELATCSAAPTAAMAAGSQATVEEAGFDVSRSASSAMLRSMYSAAALGLVERAASERAGLRIVLFGASGVGALQVFEGSFAPVSADEIFNRAAANRARCQAVAAVGKAVTARAPAAGGTDVAGTLAGLIADARGLVKAGGAANVTILTDGCQAPASRGPNRVLTDLCGRLAHGESAAAILRGSRSEFALGSATGVRIVMRGVGVGGDPAAANTVRARRLVAFWALICKKARPASCEIGSTLP